MIRRFLTSHPFTCEALVYVVIGAWWLTAIARAW